jgi:hypothetical protein
MVGVSYRYRIAAVEQVDDVTTWTVEPCLDRPLGGAGAAA